MNSGATIGAGCAAGIVFAVPIEADAFARGAREVVEIEGAGIRYHEGIVAGRRVAWCVGGVGRAAATQATRQLVAGHRPAALVSAGFAGGLEPGLKRGAIVRPTGVRGAGDDAPTLALAAPGPDRTLAVTVDRIVRTPADKAALAAATGAALVDMETLAVAEVARGLGLPCHAVRVVSDAVGDELPADVVRLATPQSTLRRLGSVVGMLGRRPRAALDLWQLWEHAVVDGRSLADALAALVASLPDPAGG